tara:strand:+ start:1574 stop:1837 length:264 start_codon:yes stop_codon:yes gene_type:complete
LRLSRFFFLFFIAFFARVHSVWCLLKDDFICRSNELHVLVHIFSIDGDYLFFFLRKVTRHLRFGTKKKLSIIINRFIIVIIRSTTTE